MFNSPVKSPVIDGRCIKLFTQHEYQVRYKIIAKLKKVKKNKKKKKHARCMRSIGNQWNLELKFRQHKLEKREAEGYCTNTFPLMIIWHRTTLRRFANKQSPSEESATETFIGMKDDKRDHQDSKFWACVSEFEWASPIHYRCKSLSMENLAKLHSVCSSFQYKVNSSV